jgi:hypothetical protein
MSVEGALLELLMAPDSPAAAACVRWLVTGEARCAQR